MVAAGESPRVRIAFGRSAHFRDLPGDTLDRLAGASRVQRLIDDELLRTRNGKLGLSLILSGAIQVSVVSANGTAAPIAVLGEGSYVGLKALFGSTVADATEYRAVGSTELATIATEGLRHLVESDEALRSHAIHLLMSRLDAAVTALVDLTHTPLAQRIARRVLAQVLAAGDAVPGEVSEVRLSQQVVAEMLGASRSSVSEELGRLERRGILERRYRGLRILDMARLEELAGSGVVPA
jgi:CRP/FNR family transcriptional regulator, cyclic AMP receptor protein